MLAAWRGLVSLASSAGSHTVCGAMNLGGLQPVTTVHPAAAFQVPALIAASGEKAGMRFLEFFAAKIRNPHTRRAYGRACDGFSGVVRGQTRCWRSRPCSRCMSPPGSSCSSRSALHRPSSCGSRRSAIGDRSGGSGEPREPDARPAARGEAGKTPVLAPEEARALLDSIEVATVVGFSDRALISLMAPAMRKPPGQCVSTERYPAGYLPALPQWTGSESRMPHIIRSAPGSY